MFRLILILVVMAASTLSAAGAFTAPRPGVPVLIIAPPWSDGAAAILARAGGREIGLHRAPFAALGLLDDPDRAVQLGAWAVWDAAALAGLCGVDAPLEGSFSNV